jgi:hypothetical protein
VQATLANPYAFDSLTSEQQEQLLALLPARNIVFDAFGRRRPSAGFLLSNPDWAHSIGAFQDDLREGRFDPQWVGEAMEAHEQRRAGGFDKHKDNEYESFWGVNQRLPSNVIAGLSSDVKLSDLFRTDVLKVGDVWSFARTFGRGDDRIFIEKEMTVCV